MYDAWSSYLWNFGTSNDYPTFNKIKLDKAIDTVIEKVGKSNRNKYRAIVYYLLVKELGQESKY